jgi:hypothetical protein
MPDARLSRTASAEARTNQELLRLTFCGIVIASFFAALGAGHNLKGLLNPSGTDAATTVLGLSAAFGFAYLISVAAALKYQGARYVDRFPLNDISAQFFYDTSINIFGIYFLALAVEWIDAHLLHLPHAWYMWPVLLALFSATYFVARVAWALAQVGIKWHYEFAGRSGGAKAGSTEVPERSK